MSRALEMRASAEKPPTARKVPATYLEQSELPFTSLVFLLPLIAAYEVGTARYLSDPVYGTQHIIAFSLLNRFFQMLGATGRHLPALAVVGVLLAWHIARNDGWRVRPRTCLLMAVESLVMAVPLIIIGSAMIQYLNNHLHLAGTFASGKGPMMILSLGAGIYEELVFRLIAFTILSFILRDIFELPQVVAVPVIIGSSAILFSAYHYLGSEPFNLPTFAFRTTAGLYFGGLMMARGFGVTAGTHAAYDLIATAMS
jgi:hypothetical protein